MPGHINVLRYLTVLVSGMLFGAGLVLSQMINPTKVIGFLDITGGWDPTLLMVMAGALAVTIPGYRLILKRTSPLFEQKFNLPVKTALDARLVAGAMLFGTGWGMAGLCPGPALTALVSGEFSIFIFTAAMITGFLLHKIFLE